MIPVPEQQVSQAEVEEEAASPRNPCAWWHHAPPIAQAMDPLEAVRVTADHLERGEPVPTAAAGIVARALRQYLAGQSDITGNLGLRPRRGGRYESPLAVERASRRNEGIKLLFDRQNGGKVERANKVAELLRAPPDEGRVTEADVFAHLVELHREFGGELPTSFRQVLRVVDGEMSVGRKR